MLDRPLQYLSLAGVATLGGAILSWASLGNPDITGIDDANITQVYAQNLASGLGYVYTPGYERVEGSTSLLWTLINTLSFLISPRPEWMILIICLVLTFGSIYLSLRFIDILCGILKDFMRLRLGIEICLTGMLGYYAWNVLSLMDVALWAFLINVMLLIMLRRINGELSKNRSCIFIILVVVLMGLTRPEAMIVAPTLIAIGIISEWKSSVLPRETAFVYGLALLFSLLTSGLVALFRIFYFGVPFPNTFYAKVSSNAFDNLANGTHYFAKFGVLSPFSVLLLIFGVCAVASVRKAYFSNLGGSSLTTHRGISILTGTTVIILIIPLATGGDHFELYRLYQPILPLLLIVPIIYVSNKMNSKMSLSGSPKVPVSIVPVITLVAFFIATTSNFFFVGNIRPEFNWAKDGRMMGGLLNEVVKQFPETRIAVAAAGGIARSYNGRVVDLLGLNWPKMAHASGRREGRPGHSAFSEKIFWTEMPELVLPSVSDHLPEQLRVSENRWNVFKELLSSAKFQNLYAPVAIPIADRYVVAAARRDWIEKYGTQNKITKFHWLN